MKLRVSYEPTASGMLSPILETLICDVDATKRARPKLKSRYPIMFIYVKVARYKVPVSLTVSFCVTCLRSLFLWDTAPLHWVIDARRCETTRLFPSSRAHLSKRSNVRG